MLKSEKAGQKFATESRLTRVQELKQARAQSKNKRRILFHSFLLSLRYPSTQYISLLLIEFVERVFLFKKLLTFLTVTVRSWFLQETVAIISWVFFVTEIVAFFKYCVLIVRNQLFAPVLNVCSLSTLRDLAWWTRWWQACWTRAMVKPATSFLICLGLMAGLLAMQCSKLQQESLKKNGLVFCCFGVLCLGCSIEFVWKISVWEVGSLHFLVDGTRVVGSLHNSPLFTGRQFACSTTCHSPGDASYCASTIGQKAYSMCRSGSLKLPGFPEFESVVNDLKSNTTDLPPPEFQVCLPVPNGIAIKQNLVDYWMANDMFQVEMTDLLEKHNTKYNPHGTKRGLTETTEGPLAAIFKAII